MKALYPDLNDNTITLTLDDEDIEDAQNQEGELQNIIEIPSETWNHVIKEIDIPTQDYFNKIKINVEDIDESDNPNTITIKIPQNPTLNNNVLENIDVETSNLITYNQNDLDFGTNVNIDLKEYNKNIKTLETLTNKQLTSNQTTYTVSQLLTNQNSDGITKESTLYVNVPVTPAPVIGFANITDNGQYEPKDFNSNGEYDPLNTNNNFDYLNQINVSVSNIRKIDTIKIGSTVISNSSTNWHWFPRGQPYNVSGGQEVLIITKYNDWWNITFHYNISSNNYSTITVGDNSWVYINNLSYSPYMIEFIENNQTFYRMRDDSGYDPAYCDFYKTIEFNIDWMIFN